MLFKVLLRKVNLWEAADKAADFRSLHQRRGLCLMGRAAGFHDSLGPSGHNYTLLGGQW